MQHQFKYIYRILQRETEVTKQQQNMSIVKKVKMSKDQTNKCSKTKSNLVDNEEEHDYDLLHLYTPLQFL